MDEKDPFFDTVEFFWPSEHPNCNFDVRDQQKTNLCTGFVASTTMFAEQYLNSKGLPKGSEQEYLDRLHNYFLPTDVEPGDMVPREGFPNKQRNTYSYTKTYGVYSEFQYPFVGYYQGFQGAKHDQEEKMFLTNFEYIYSSDKIAYHKEIEKQLRIQPLAAGIKFTPSFANWNGEGVYEFTQDEIDFMEEAKRKKKNNEKHNDYGSHAVTVVGFGKENGKRYYVIQNSYGLDWGHKGYAKIERSLLRRFYYPIGIEYGKRKIDIEVDSENGGSPLKVVLGVPKPKAEDDHDAGDHKDSKRRKIEPTSNHAL